MGEGRWAGGGWGRKTRPEGVGWGGGCCSDIWPVRFVRFGTLVYSCYKYTHCSDNATHIFLLSLSLTLSLEEGGGREVVSSLILASHQPDRVPSEKEKTRGFNSRFSHF